MIDWDLFSHLVACAAAIVGLTMVFGGIGGMDREYTRAVRNGTQPSRHLGVCAHMAAAGLFIATPPTMALLFGWL